MKILVINGVNLNMIGIREPELYGKKDYKSLVSYIKKEAKSLGIEVTCFQSNYEGAICEKIQKAYQKYDGIIINAGAYTHTSVAILDALKAVEIPTVEVHLTDVYSREEFRQHSFISLYAEKIIVGKGFIGYGEALKYFSDKTAF
ncbi:MAG: type II 3-dehydroquinate dehydratase [Clostridiales bacterium]|nr:type II 3-dehydroquinate dehydratase [Clostridiales bacterium]